MLNGNGTEETVPAPIKSKSKLSRIVCFSVTFVVTLVAGIYLVSEPLSKMQRTYDAIYRLRMVAISVSEPLLARELPAPAYFNSSGVPTISWRGDIVNDFAAGERIKVVREETLYDAGNNELLGMRYRFFCDPSDKGIKKTNIFAVINGNSLFENGNEWQKEKEIPNGTLVAVYLSFIALDHWALPGDIWVGGPWKYPSVVSFESMEFPAGEVAFCVFWDREIWEFRRKSDLLVALKFADLDFADSADREKLLSNIGRRVSERRSKPHVVK